MRQRTTRQSTSPPWRSVRLRPAPKANDGSLILTHTPDSEPWRRMRGPLIMILATMTLGTVGYMLIEQWAFDDAAFMVLITLATIGYGEVQPLSGPGRLFTSLLILVGVAGLSYTFTTFTGILFEGHLTQQWEQRRLAKMISKLHNHYILCGYGRVGQQIARELVREGETVVVIDHDPRELERAAATGLWVVNGNATEDETLHAAGIGHARGLITAVNGDADNTFITISAHALRPDMPIVARVIREEATPKLRHAGATHVVSPYALAGYQMATLAARSATVSAIEHLHHGADDLVVVEIRIDTDSPLIGRTLAETRELIDRQLTILGLQRNNQMIAPPPVDLPLLPGDVFAVCGTRSQIRTLEDACEGPR